MPVSILDLVFPSVCLWCSEQSGLLCERCLDRLPKTAIEVFRGEGMSFRGAAFGRLDAHAKLLLHEVKDRQQTAYLKAIGPHLAASFDNQLEHLGWQSAQLVPIPPSQRGWSSRGFNPAESLVRELVRHSRFPLKLTRAIEYRRTVDDQRVLSASQRSQNLAGAFVVPRPDRLHGPKAIFIVDDVVTTGSTILAARSALAEAGFEAAGFFAFAETFLKNATTGTKWV